jgi:hypothetical protein
MQNAEIFKQKPNFSLKTAINEVLDLARLDQKGVVYSIKIDLPEEINITGKKVIFQGLLFKLIKYAQESYSSDNFQNRIVLITSKLENEASASISVTSGGQGLSFLEKILATKNLLLLREGSKILSIQRSHDTLKRIFKGYIEIISAKNKGFTFKCHLPLNQ